MGFDWRWWLVPVPSGVEPNYFERVGAARDHARTSFPDRNAERTHARASV